CVPAGPALLQLRTVHEQSDHEIGANCADQIADWIGTSQVLTNQSGQNHIGIDRREYEAPVLDSNVLPPFLLRVKDAAESILVNLGLVELPTMMFLLDQFFVKRKIDADLVAAGSVAFGNCGHATYEKDVFILGKFGKLLMLCG